MTSPREAGATGPREAGAASARTNRAAGGTDVGRQREINEDRFHVDVDRGVFIVVDGIGGHAAGETAAETAIAAMRERLTRQTGTIPDRLREAITIANNEIHRLAATRPDWHGMACVLTAAVVDGDRAVIGHVGDSRLYKLQGDRIDKITPDHSPIGEREDARELSEVEAMRHPRRNEVYRDVGSEPREMSDPDFVFIAEIELPPDAALLICSDGLTDLVPSETIRQIVCSRAASPDEVVRGLIAAANDAGGKDNITVVFVEGPEFDARANGRAAATGHGAERRADQRPRHGWLIAMAIVAASVAGLALGLNWEAVTSLTGGSVNVLGFQPGATVVRPGESIMTAIKQAAPGTSIIVEPGEYREQLTLKDNVRVISREPRGATIRLPGVAAERDVAVMAVGVSSAELAGFRIVGDAATPLGVGVLARDGTVRLVDLDISGATTTGLDLGGGGERGAIDLIGSEIHDNPGSALLIRTGANVRITHNVFEKNAFSGRTLAAFLTERDAKAEWSRNVFRGIGPEAIAGTDQAVRSALLLANWFVAARPATTAPPATGRSGRGR